MTNIEGKYKPKETARLSLKGPDGRLEKHFKTGNFENKREVTCHEQGSSVRPIADFPFQ